MSYFSSLSHKQETLSENPGIINADLGKYVISRHFYGQVFRTSGTAFMAGLVDEILLSQHRGIMNDVVKR
jgi:hypothetical protein